MGTNNDLMDITDDWTERYLDEAEERSWFVLNGNKEKFPSFFVRDMVKRMRFYSTSSIDTVKNNYEMLMEKFGVPLRSKLYMTKLLFRVSSSVVKNKEYADLVKKYGDEHDRLYGEENSLRDFIRFKLPHAKSVLLTDVMLVNFQHHKNGFFSAYSFDIIDMKGNTIQGVFVYDEFIYNIFSQTDKRQINSLNMINTARTSPKGTTFAVLAMPLSQKYGRGDKKGIRGKRIKVLHIQQGGVGKKLPMPLIRF